MDRYMVKREREEIKMEDRRWERKEIKEVKERQPGIQMERKKQEKINI